MSDRRTTRQPIAAAEPAEEPHAFPTVSRASVALHTATAEVSKQIRAADTNATALLAIFAAALAGLIALTRTEISLWATGLLYIALALVGCSIWLLLSALCRQHGGEPSGFHRWAWIGDATELLAELTEPEPANSRRQAAHLAALSCLARTKHGLISLAVRLLHLAAIPLAIALPLT